MYKQVYEWHVSITTPCYSVNVTFTTAGEFNGLDIVLTAVIHMFPLGLHYPVNIIMIGYIDADIVKVGMPAVTSFL
jgi:hypothetical protein